MSSQDEIIARLRDELHRQQRLIEANYALHSTLDLDELLQLTLQVATEGVHADRGTVFLLSEDGDELWSRVQAGKDTIEIRLPVGQGIAGSVAESGDTERISDAYEDERFDQSWDMKSGYRTRQILCTPIRTREGEIVGVFQMLNKTEGGDFNEGDERYLAAISVHASLAVENAQLHASALEKERYDREVHLAQNVQRRLQPEMRSIEKGVVSVAGMNELCEDASGDYYDILTGLPNARVGAMVGDVSGHGLKAALVMAEARAYTRAFFETESDPALAVTRLNSHLEPDLDSSTFMTFFAVSIDPENGEVQWVNGGHDAPYLWRAATGELTTLEPTGPLLGVMGSMQYRAGEPFTLEKNDVLFIFTDGLTESRNPAKDIYGEERLEASLKQVAAESADGPAILEGIRSTLRKWCDGHAAEDDLTMIAIKRIA